MAAETKGIDPTRRDGYRHWARDLLRYGDTDRQGHVNNAVFPTFLETGRCALLFDPTCPERPENTAFVLARLLLDYRAELHWPGEVEIGTAVLRIGRSSITFCQGVFVGDTCFASGETVVVFTDTTTRRSTPFPDDMRAWFSLWRHPDAVD
jgi:acyl-CoA thioester hydrolase